MQTQDNPLIRMDCVSKSFFTSDTETRALDSVSVEVRSGEFLCINGPSGCGKSTLLSLMGLLDRPCNGTYYIDGELATGLDRNQLAKLRNEKIGFIFQAFNLIGDLTAADNVELPLRFRKGVSPDERRERARQVLKKVGMDHRARYYPHQLSGGQQQRVAVARALVTSPSILLADEPTGNLDSTNGEQVMELLGELHQSGATICMVSHDDRYCAIAQRQIHLFDGRIIENLEYDALKFNSPRPIRSGAAKAGSS